MATKPTPKADAKEAMADAAKAQGEKGPTLTREQLLEQRLAALESAVHGLKIKHGQQDKRLDGLEEVNSLRLRSRGLID